MALTPIQPVVFDANAVAITVCGTPVPIEKAEFKLHCKKTEITSTSSYSLGYLWDEFAPGNLGGSLNWESHWRIAQAVTPPMLIPGMVLPVRIYVRKPRTNGPRDLGAFFAARFIIDESDLTLDPKGGVIGWKVSATMTGPVSIYAS